MPVDWKVLRTQLAATSSLKYTVQRNATAASFAEVIDAWQNDAAFRGSFNQWLAEVPFAAFRWETPAVNTATINRPFEFVVLDSPGLAQRPDRDAFAEHFYRTGAEALVATFENLGRNAMLIAPCPLAADQIYPHLGAFVRGAPPEQSDRLWQAVGSAMQQRINDQPVWLSTAGAGVSWLHIRLDNTPKYYHHDGYRKF